MSSDAHDFGESLDMGLKWEQILKPRLKQVLVAASLESISFEENPDMQRNGIDMVLQQENPNVDVKARGHYALQYGDILLETWSVWEENKVGWAFKPDIDLVAYVFENEPGTNLKQGYFIVMSDEFRDWFQENADNYPEKEAKNGSFGGYTTLNRAVPIEDFPQGTLIEFDPTQFEPAEDEQQELSDWLEVDDD